MKLGYNYHVEPALCITSEDAINWVKKNKKNLVEKFTNLNDFPPVTNPFSMFMAGAPGVGKTEFSKSFIEVYYTVDPSNKMVRIDTDEVRASIPGYNGSNSFIFQRAAALGLEPLLDSVHKNHQNVMVDTTFSNLDIATSNIKRALGRNRNTGIIYLYQEPEISWKFTKIRKHEEGRIVPKEFFIEAFFKAKNNVNKVKEIFGKRIKLSLLVLDENHSIKLSKFNIERVDSHIKIDHTRKELFNSL